MAWIFLRNHTGWFVNKCSCFRQWIYVLKYVAKNRTFYVLRIMNDRRKYRKRLHVFAPKTLTKFSLVIHNSKINVRTDVCSYEVFHAFRRWVETWHEIWFWRILLRKWRRLRRFLEEKFSTRHGILSLRRHEHEIYGHVDQRSYARAWAINSPSTSIPRILATEFGELIFIRIISKIFY